MPSATRLADLMIADLARSGIAAKYVKILQLKVLTPAETADFMKADFNTPSYEIPYFNSRGKPIGYSRLKNLQPNAKFGSKSKKLTYRYLQKTNTAPHLYIPPVFDWPRDKETQLIKVPRLVITEGEKKAIKACLSGIPCVALGGVDSFKSSKRGIFLLEEFDEFDLSETELEICYDSDFNTNEGVRKAMHQLSAGLSQKEPVSTAYVMLDAESTGNGKQGLDDFLATFAGKTEALQAFDKLPRKADARQDRLSQLDHELCYLNSAGKLYNIPEDRYYDSAAALILDYGPRFKVPDPDEPRKQIPAVKVWIDERGPDTWVDSLVYEPGKPKRYRQPKKKHDSINLWTASDVKPIKGKVDPWLDLVRYVMHDDFNTDWFLQWLAYPLVHPGSKLLQTVFVYSKAQGVGKNFIIDPLIRKIYGPAYQMIKANQLDSDFNSWMRNKQFVFGEEIYMSDRRDRETAMGTLKSLVTNEYVSVNTKFRPEETFKNYVQFYLTANQANALALDSADRRITVVHAPEEKRDDTYYNELDRWSREEDSAGKLLYHLLNKVDVSKFNPNAGAPMTADKQEIIETTRGMVEYYVALLEDTPMKIFSVNGVRSEQELFTTGEIHSAINAYARANSTAGLGISPDSMGRYLSGSRILLRRRLTFRTAHGVATPSLYSAFNHLSWKKRTDEEWLTHYRRTHPDQFLTEKRLKMDGSGEVKDDKVVDISERRKKKTGEE